MGKKSLDPKKLCLHTELHFGSGGFYLFCTNCGVGWMAIDGSNKPDHNRQALNAGIGRFQFRNTMTAFPITVSIHFKPNPPAGPSSAAT